MKQASTNLSPESKKPLSKKSKAKPSAKKKSSKGGEQDKAALKEKLELAGINES
jgi:hypothetical protein